MIVHGIQNEIELETTAYNLFTIKEHSSGLFITSALCLSVVYHPDNRRGNANLSIINI